MYMKILSSFVHSGQEYEIRITYSGNIYQIRVFTDNHPANIISYCIDSQVNDDIENMHGSNPINMIAERAKEDVINGIGC